MSEIRNGYTGKLLRIDLNELNVRVEDIDTKILEEFIGGVGFGVKLLYDEIKRGTDPLDPENKIIFTTSPLSINRIPGGGSIMLCFKSPATNGWGESRCGGDFGPDLRRANFDHLIIEGKSEKPLYVVIDGEKVDFKSAHHLMGKTVSEKERIIRNEVPEGRFSIMCIGPGGENLVRFATVMCRARASGRGGAGAVMGSKNLIAIVIRSKSENIHMQSEQLTNAVRRALDIIRNNPISNRIREHGTTGDIVRSDDVGDWPTKNFRSNYWGKAKSIYDTFYKNNYVRNYGCYRGCPIKCGRMARVNKGKFTTPLHGGCEYESISTFTAFVYNLDVDAAVHSTYLCNEYGIDTISSGSVIACAMDCYENDIIIQKDVEGLDLSWGNPDILPLLVRMIAKREGLGDLLARGVMRAAQELGKGAEELAMHGKGLEGPAHDPRSGKTCGLSFGTANRGMCHIHPFEGPGYDNDKLDWGMKKYGVPDPNTLNRWDEGGRGKIVKILQDGMIVPDILSICKFFMYSGLTLENYAEMLSALTGWDIDDYHLIKTGERVYNLQKLFNIREGLKREDDLFPERMMKLPEFGRYKDNIECLIKDYNMMLNEYYKARGWDPVTGIPKDEKLRELGLL